MSTINACTITDPFGAEATCAKFTIDDLTKAFKLAGTTVVGLRYTLSFWVKSEAAGSLIVYSKECASSTEWVKYVITFTATSENLMIGFNNTGTYYIYHPQLELGNKATDWKLSPEDVDEQISNCPTKEEVTAAITASREGIELNVSTYYTTKTEFENLSIGGRNLAVKTATSKSVTGTNVSNQSFVPYYLSVNWNTLIGEPVTISFDYEFSEGSSKTTSTDTDVASVGMSSSPWNRWVSIPNPSKGLTGHCSGTFVIPDTMASNWGIGVRLDYFSGTLTLSNFKMEKGNKETDWTPAPEDIEDRIKTAEAAIEVNADNINLSVKEADITGDYLISKINLDSTTAAIEAKHINLTGYVTVTDLATSGATTINGSNVTTGTISADRIDVNGLFAKQASIGLLTITTDGSLTADYTGDGTADVSFSKTYFRFGVVNNSSVERAYFYADTEHSGAGVNGRAVVYGNELVDIRTNGSVRIMTNNSLLELVTISNTGNLTTAGTIYEGGTALSSKYAQLNTTVSFPGISLDSNGAYIYGENNNGNIYFRYKPSSTSDYNYITVAEIVSGINSKLPLSGGTLTGSIYIPSGYAIGYESGARINFGDTSVRPHTNNTYSMGSSNNKWTYVYATNGTIQTSDENEKDIISGITEQYESMFLDFNPILYRWRDLGDGARHDRIHCGLGAQSVLESALKHGLDSTTFAAICYNTLSEPTIDGRMEIYGLNYGELHGLEIHMIQKNYHSIEQLKQQFVSQEEINQYLLQQLMQAQAEIGQLQTQLKALA